MLHGTKSPLQSLTIKALLVDLAIKSGAVVGLALTRETVDEGLVIALAVASLVPTVVAWVGRVRATEKIGPS